MPALQIYNPRERAAVAAADGLLRVAAAGWRAFRSGVRPTRPARILLLRLERIGDLIMILPAIASLRTALPEAEITLVVGPWNEGLAKSIPGITRVDVLSARWLARGTEGMGLGSLLAHARRWRGRRYDLAVNFEPDIRTNLLLAAAGARWTVGYRSGGGGPLLDEALDYLPAEHTSDNARRLVAAAVPAAGAAAPPVTLDLPASHREQAAKLLAGRPRPVVAMHVPGGREVKQWNPNHFASVARSLIERRRATILLTGSAADRALVEPVLRALPSRHVVDASSGLPLLTTAALLERCELMITGDTGPMHLAAAVGTPIAAVFGPSDPRRYAPRNPLDRVLRVDLPCAPCNRIRLPPARCSGRIPDCLALIPPDRVLAAAEEILDACAPPARRE